MPATKRRPPSVVDPEELNESSPDDEVREGEADMPMSHSRKRSAKNAKRTKAPMDTEGGCSCGGGGRKKCSCDSSCGSKKMDEALTAQEYLDACDLGIQNRSLPYIRTRLTMTTATRADKKCGNSNIPDDKQCKAGGGIGRKLATGAAVAGGVAAAAYGLSRMRRGGGGMRALAPAGGVSGGLSLNNTMGNRARRAAYGASGRVRSAVTNVVEGSRSQSFTRAGSLGNMARRAANTSPSSLRQSAGRGLRNARRGLRNAGSSLQSAANSATFATRRGQSFTAGNSLGNTARRVRNSVRSNPAYNAIRSRTPGGRGGAITLRNRGGVFSMDSVWADGFSPETY